MVAASHNMSCKLCGSHRVVKDGLRKGVQRWECRSCGKKFVDNHAPPGMKTPAVQIASAIRMYYQGISLNTICKQLQQNHNNYPSDSAVYSWVNRYTHSQLERSKNDRPEVGNTWIVDETGLIISGQQVWIWDVVDTDTCYLLTTLVSLAHDVKDAQLLIQKAIEKAGKTPEKVISEKLTEHLKQVNFAINNPANKNNKRFMVSSESTSETDLFHSILQRRTSSMTVLKSVDRVIEFANGWLLSYNYFSPQEYLCGQTPAEVAKITYRRKNLDY